MKSWIRSSTLDILIFYSKVMHEYYETMSSLLLFFLDDFTVIDIKTFFIFFSSLILRNNYLEEIHSSHVEWLISS